MLSNENESTIPLVFLMDQFELGGIVSELNKLQCIEFIKKEANISF